ncbi:hypothetical protein FOXB_02085 [Fusarium oxysporum f. sp. conglutinans Fo5176]|uniref:Uncharacterized protein n=1 Tax=Fusarium oxysporum (strain Fo5176) TaxID=660025 RepID=F9F6R0_FUSOF|nr:hypothetical protein FOXB_02085 [Fusarium oxysporum f. sp. conglutinans Fo5176]
MAKAAENWASKYKIFELQQDICDNLLLRPDNAPLIAALGLLGTGAIWCEFVPEQSTSPSNCRYMGIDFQRIREYLKAKYDWDLRLKGGRRSAATTEEGRTVGRELWLH